ncbi:hypothetical protein V6N13_053694 [Hibiscus sabdariffa]
MLNSQGTWIWTTFQHHWPLAVLLRIEVVKESDPLFSLDAVGWGLNANHRFTVKSVYELRSGTLNGDAGRIWMVIRKFRGLSKIKVLMWLVCCDKLITNFERTRRHFTSDSLCPMCNEDDEDVDHVLRHFRSAKSVWSLCVNPTKLTEFFTLPFWKWIDQNLIDVFSFGLEHLNWDSMFATILWNLRRHRNAVVFENTIEEWGYIGVRSKWLADNMSTAMLDTCFTVTHGSTVVPVGPHWSPPLIGWVQFNSDGGRQAFDGSTSCNTPKIYPQIFNLNFEILNF